MPVEDLKFGVEKNEIVFEPPVRKFKKNAAPWSGFLSATILVVACFAIPLYRLLRLAASDDLYSEIPLIPFVTAYLLWMRRDLLPRSFRSALIPAAGFLTAGFALIAFYWLTSMEPFWTLANYLAVNILAFLLIFTAVCFCFLGKTFMSAAAFPMALLIFIVPFPDPLRRALEESLQYGSTTFAEFFFQLSGVPVLRDGLDFRLPNCVIHVAPECSGIHSTIVLCITSLIGSWLFLRSPAKRTLLVLAVVPLALIRNGFRIFVIGWLCATRGPQMLASPIHRHGGPLFFVLSLIPLLLLLLFLGKTEKRPKTLNDK